MTYIRIASIGEPHLRNCPAASVTSESSPQWLAVLSGISLNGKVHFRREFILTFPWPSLSPQTWLTLLVLPLLIPSLEAELAFPRVHPGIGMSGFPGLQHQVITTEASTAWTEGSYSGTTPTVEVSSLHDQALESQNLICGLVVIILKINIC